MRTVVALAIGLASFGAEARFALARERARAVLTYDRVDTARDACPDEATMRGLVGARLGYDPFVDKDGPGLRIELHPDGREIVARVIRTGLDGEKKGERVLRSSGGDCAELASSVSLAVALAIDPDALQSPKDPVPPSEPPPEEVAPAPPTPAPGAEAASPSPWPAAHRSKPSTPKSARPPLGIRIDAGIVLGAGVVPGVAFGPRLGVGLDGSFWSVSAEGTAIIPGSEATPFGTASASVVYGALVPCLHPGFARMFLVDLCAAGGVGAISSEARNVSRSFPTTNVYAVVGPRAGVTIVPTQNVGFRLGTDLGVALSRVHLNIDDHGTPREVWASPPVSFLGTLGVVLRFR